MLIIDNFPRIDKTLNFFFLWIRCVGYELYVSSLDFVPLLSTVFCLGMQSRCLHVKMLNFFLSVMEFNINNFFTTNNTKKILSFFE